MSRNIVEVIDVVKKFNGRKTVLDGVSFSVADGDFVTIHGASGSGKTTLLNIVGGLDRPTSGDVVIEGNSIIGLSEDSLARMRLEKIGFVFQDFNLLMDMTVRQNLLLPLRLSRRKGEDRIDGVLRKFDILDIADEWANKISGGEAQRVAIARALMNEPRIILADEPTGNLDLENTLNVVKMFRLAREDFGTTVLLATHDRDIAEFSTMTICLHDGKTVIEKPGQ